MSDVIKINVGKEARVELHDKLGLTSAEISINKLPAGASIPCFHSHRQNEEVYIVTAGKGIATIDGKTIELVAGDCLRVAPAALRRFGAAADSAFEYLCIQVKANSLEAFSAQDAEIPA